MTISPDASYLYQGVDLGPARRLFLPTLPDPPVIAPLYLREIDSASSPAFLIQLGQLYRPLKPTRPQSSSSSPAPGTYSNPTFLLPKLVTLGISSPPCPTHLEAERQMMDV